jgi:3-hydroxy-9,10-secoandrosta-1,3,5(10)-triene-9,17-dione monooxygenase reductase component
MSPSAVSPPSTDLRAAFGRFATGVAFVTAEVEGEPYGLIVSSFAAVSLDPPLLSFCPARTSATWRRMRTAGRFAVHVLGAPHARFAREAATPGADRFAQPLSDPLAVFDCVMAAEHEAGDHWIVIGRVCEARIAHAAPDPLVYFQSSFWSLK